MKVNIEGVAVKSEDVSYKDMLKTAGVYKFPSIDVYVISLGDGKNALYVSDNEVEMLDKTTWFADMFTPVSTHLTITFPGAV